MKSCPRFYYADKRQIIWRIIFLKKYPPLCITFCQVIQVDDNQRHCCEQHHGYCRIPNHFPTLFVKQTNCERKHTKQFDVYGECYTKACKEKFFLFHQRKCNNDKSGDECVALRILQSRE